MRRIIALAVLLLCLTGPRVQFRGELCMACQHTTGNVVAAHRV